MSVIRPFRAYRPRPEMARDIASFPYDVISSDEARVLAQGNPLSFLHVVKPEIDLDPAVSLHDDRVYDKGRENLYRMIADGKLVRDSSPSFYIYQQRMGTHVQAGVVGACSVREYEEDKIKKHEFTRKDKEDDRTRHVTTCNANAEPVFLASRPNRTLSDLIDRVRSGKPACDITATDGIGHAVWVVQGADDIAAITRIFAGMDSLYIADGHHRTAAAVRHGQMMRAKSGGGADAPHEWFMATVFPADQLQILDYNRVMLDLNGQTADAFISRIEEKFTVTPSDKVAKPVRARTFGMFLTGRWHTLEARPGTFPADDPVASLDVSILQNNLLAPVLGIKDPRTDTRIDFVGGIRGTGELEKRCREGCAAAFAFYPTSMDQLMRVADMGQVMPPKSTWFEPKLRSGLTVRLIDE
jgi:uncharacterized protein (DUF1015 family)